MSPAHHQTFRILQSRKTWSTALGAMRREWQAETLIHGDVRFDNVLITARQPDSPPRLHLVDWELVQVGDPAWDVAGALQELLRFWIFSLPLAPELSAEQRVSEAEYPLAVVQSAVRAFWQGYRRAADLEAPAAGELLLRAVRFSAARLLQSAYESSRGAEKLPASGVMELQVSANVLANPARAAFHLYGLPMQTAGPVRETSP